MGESSPEIRNAAVSGFATSRRDPTDDMYAAAHESDGAWQMRLSF